MPLFKSGKRSIFDLKVKDESGRWYIIEMQRTMKIDFINRVQFYGSYSYVTQIEEGITHGDLLPVIVISIIGQKIFPDELPYVNYHHFKETTTNKQYLFSLSYVFVELGKFKENDIKSEMDQWLHLFKCATEEKEPPKEIKSSTVLSAYRELEQYNWTQEQHDAYVRSNLAIAKEEEELEDAREEGEHNRARKMALKMIAKKKPIQEIIEFTDLSKEQIESLKD